MEDVLPHDLAFATLPGLVEVFAHGDLPAADVHIARLRKSGKVWSGLTVAVPGGAIVVFNDAHPITRVRATLMEEFFHLQLGHPPSLISLHSGARTHNAAVESEAYGSGAAALVPYQGMKLMVDAGCRVIEIAANFEVSPELVLFRAKVTKLYRVLVQGH